MVVLAGHGAGTEDDFLLKDENPANSSLSIPDLREVFAQAKKKLKIKVDILGMDVCLMSMVEVCYELRGVVEYLVGSESFSPAAGWPYGQILQKLQDNQDAKTEELAKMIVDEYIGFYSDYVMGGLSVDQSVLKVSASSPVVTAVKNFTKAMKGRLKRPAFQDAIILAHWESQSYNGELFVDLQDFCELLAARDPRAARACRKVIEAIDGALVRKSCFTGVENQFSKGVSIYFPWSDVAPSYKKLAFAGRSGWNDFLHEYVEQTRRKQRGFKQGNKNERAARFCPRQTAQLRVGCVGERTIQKIGGPQIRRPWPQSHPQHAQPADQCRESRVERVYSGEPGFRQTYRGVLLQYSPAQETQVSHDAGPPGGAPGCVSCALDAAIIPADSQPRWSPARCRACVRRGFPTSCGGDGIVVPSGYQGVRSGGPRVARRQ